MLMSFLRTLASLSTNASTAVKQQEFGGVSRLRWAIFTPQEHKGERGDVCFIRVEYMMIFYVILSPLRQLLVC